MGEIYMTILSLQKRSEVDLAFPFRNQSRFEFNNGFWYFSMREGLQGPFMTKEEAEIEAMLLLRGIGHIDTYGFDREHKYTQAARLSA